MADRVAVQVEEEESDAQEDTIESLIKEMGERLLGDDSSSTVTGVAAVVPACLISWVSDGAVGCGEYRPDKVSIGPFHRDPSHWMEKEKKELLHGVLPQEQQPRQQHLRFYLTAMLGLEGRARLCYNRTFSSMTREAFACMLLLDGFFLLSRFVPLPGAGLPRALHDDDITVVRDVVFLLQNQIPFFVLEQIYKLIVETGVVVDSAIDKSVVVASNVFRRVGELVQRHGYSAITLNSLDLATRPCHFLHLLHMYFRPTAVGYRAAQTISSTGGGEVQLTVRNSQPSAINNVVTSSSTGGGGAPTPTSGDVISPDVDTSGGRGGDRPPARWRAATYYHVAGVRLVRRELDGGSSILDVELRGGTLRVPCLTVDSNTWRMLRNMVAMEQESPSVGNHVTSYCLFMSQMASTEEDVALLVRKGILSHFLGSDADVAVGLARLCDGVVLDIGRGSYLRPEQEALEELCRCGWRKSAAWLRHSKCDNYLMALAVAAAVVVFVCTVEQSVFAALGYVKGRYG